MRYDGMSLVGSGTPSSGDRHYRRDEEPLEVTKAPENHETAPLPDEQDEVGELPAVGLERPAEGDSDPLGESLTDLISQMTVAEVQRAVVRGDFTGAEAAEAEARREKPRMSVLSLRE